MALLTANAGQTTVKEGGGDIFKVYPVGADVHIWHGGFVGMDPAGNAKAFQAGDVLLGIAHGEADNTATGNAAGDIDVVVHTWTDFLVNLSGAAQTDVGRFVFATTDNQDDVGFIGHPDAFVGVFKQLDADSGDAVIRMDLPGRMPANGSYGQAMIAMLDGTEFISTGVGTASPMQTSGEAGGQVLATKQLGTGITSDAIAGHLLTFDAVAEIATAGIESPGLMDGALGMTFEAEINMEDIGDAANLDADWGFVDTHTEVEREDVEASVNLACFHMDGASANILAHSDDATTDVAAVDTTIDNVTTSAAWKKFKVIARIDGAIEFWIDNARVLSGTTFAIDPAIATYRGLVNMEKTSNDTLGTLMLRNLRIAGVSAH